MNAPVDESIGAIVAFVEGRIEPVDFGKMLHEKPDIERVLNDDPTLKAGTYIGTNTFQFILEQDISSPGGVLNIHGALSQFLERKQIAFKPTKVYSDFYNLILSAQPRWLGVSIDWLKQNVLSAAGDRKKKELRDWLRQRLLELFKYRDKPPKWIQSPNWPIGENGPLVFLGQMRISNYFHDEAAAYVFHDPKTGRCETVIQVH